MAIISKPFTFTASTTISSSEVNSNFDTMYNEFNGSINDANLASGAVTADKLASDAVTSAKIADGAVGQNALADGAATSEKQSATIAFRAYLSSSQNISASTNTKVEFDAELYDEGSDFDSTTNNRFIAPVAGVYVFSATWRIGNTNDGTDVRNMLFKNGSEEARLSSIKTSGGGFAVAGSVAMKLAQDDYVEVYGWHNDSTSRSIDMGSNETWFSGYLLGAV